jgi:hypothetical protein
MYLCRIASRCASLPSVPSKVHSVWKVCAAAAGAREQTSANNRMLMPFHSFLLELSDLNSSRLAGVVTPGKNAGN